MDALSIHTYGENASVPPTFTHPNTTPIGTADYGKLGNLKAAKLAQKGKGRKVRFQGGTVFPAAVAITLILGFALIVYSRQTLPEADSTPPTIND